MKAIVLAAGKGTRLRPITDNRPKHILEVAGVPILKRIIDSLLMIDIIDEIYIVVNYQSEQIIASIKNWYEGSDQNKIKFVKQDEQLGTGHAVKIALDQINSLGFKLKEFLVVNGDVILGKTMNELIQSFKDEKFDGWIVGAKVKDVSKYGILVQKNGLLQSIKEKPKNANPNSLINAGVYILPELSLKLFESMKLSVRGEQELTDVVQQLINLGSKIKIKEMKSDWFDIGHVWQLLEANESLMKSEIELNIHKEAIVEDNVHLLGKVHIAKKARIRSGVYIEGPAFIDENADIGPNCYVRSSTYLGKNVRIGNGCEIKNSIIYSNSHAAHLSYIGDSVIGENTNIGAGTITANLRHDGKDIKITVKGERKSSGRRKMGSIIGDNVKIGIGVNLLPGVIISSNSWINAGDVIKRDL